MKSAKSERFDSVSLDSEFDNYKRRNVDVQAGSDSSYNAETGNDDDDDYNVEDTDTTDEYSTDDETINKGLEYDDTDHNHDYRLPVAEDDSEYFFNEGNSQDDRF